MIEIGSVERSVRVRLRWVSWPAVVAALLIMVASLALALLLLLVSLRCVDTYQLMTMGEPPGCAIVAPAIAQVSLQVPCTAPSLLYDQLPFTR